MGNTACNECPCEEKKEYNTLSAAVLDRAELVKPLKIRNAQDACCLERCDQAIPLSSIEEPSCRANGKMYHDENVGGDVLQHCTGSFQLNAWEVAVSKNGPDDMLGMQAKYCEAGLQIVDISSNGAVARSTLNLEESSRNLKVGDVILHMEKGDNGTILFQVTRPSALTAKGFTQ